jgi:hypothetical protein
MRKNLAPKKVTRFLILYCRKCQLRFQTGFVNYIEKYTHKKYMKNGAFFYNLQGRHILYDAWKNKSSILCPIDKNYYWEFEGLISNVDLHYLDSKIKKLLVLL